MRKFRKWTLRISATLLLIGSLLLLIVLKPGLSYATKTEHRSFTIYHQQSLDQKLLPLLDSAGALLQRSELYKPALRLQVCLADGSPYPGLVRRFRGPAFGYGFADKVVLQGRLDCAANTVSLNGYSWNATELLAHEMTHCLQFNALGFWHSNPVAGIPEWKWEGYAEYVSRRGAGQGDLRANMARLAAWDKEHADSWEVLFEDGTVAPRTYYRYWLLVQYCMDVKGLSFRALLADGREEAEVQEELNSWFKETGGRP